MSYPMLGTFPPMLGAYLPPVLNPLGSPLGIMPPPLMPSATLPLGLMPSLATQQISLMTGMPSQKLKVDPSLQPYLSKILSSPFGSSFITKMLSQPNLTSLTIKPWSLGPSIRSGLGRPPEANTTLQKNGGSYSAVIEMDPMMATIVDTVGKRIRVGPDNVLFHELAHVGSIVEGGLGLSSPRPNLENLASYYEGLYGGYTRNYYAPGAQTHWLK